MSKALNTYRVLYAVTRAEWYEIDAPDTDDAEHRAYFDGEQVDKLGNPTDCGEAHDIVFCQLEQVETGGAQ